MVYLRPSFKSIALCVSFAGVVFGFVVGSGEINEYFLRSMWYVRFLSNRVPGYRLVVGKYFTKYIDAGWLEFYGARGLGGMFSNFSCYFQLIQENKVKIYLVVMFMWFVFLIFIYLYSSIREHYIEAVGVAVLPLGKCF